MVERETSLVKKMEISVAEAEKRTGKNTVNMQETYTVYLIETRWMTLLFLLFLKKKSMLLLSQVIVLLMICFHFHSQASWNCPRRGNTCRSGHFVETLQWVWTAENVPPGHLPVHHRPSTTREKGKRHTYRRWTYQAHTVHLLLVETVGVILSPSPSVAG